MTNETTPITTECHNCGKVKPCTTEANGLPQCALCDVAGRDHARAHGLLDDETAPSGTLAELLAEFGFTAQTLDMNSREEAWIKMDGTAEIRIDDGDGNAPEDWAQACILTVHAYGDPVVRFDGDGFGLADWLEAHDVRQPQDAEGLS